MVSIPLSLFILCLSFLLCLMPGSSPASSHRDTITEQLVRTDVSFEIRDAFYVRWKCSGNQNALLLQQNGALILCDLCLNWIVAKLVEKNWREIYKCTPRQKNSLVFVEDVFLTRTLSRDLKSATIDVCFMHWVFRLPFANDSIRLWQYFQTFLSLLPN